MKICLFICDLLAGGAQRVFLRLADGLARIGQEVDLVVATSNGPLFESVSRNIRLVKLGCAGTIWALPKLVMYLRKNRPDVLLSTLTRANIVACIAKKIANVGITLVVREANAILPPSQRIGYHELLELGLARRFYCWADHCIAVSADVKRDLINKVGIDPEKTTVIHNPIDTLALASETMRQPNHPWLDEKLGVPVIIAVGRLDPQKDYFTLLKAHKILLAKTDARLIILGEGWERKRLEQFAREIGIDSRVDFRGYVDNPASYVSRADLYVLSSKWEGLSNSLLEAITLGISVIVTDCSQEVTEILTLNNIGNIVRTGNADEMAMAMKSSLTQPHNRDAQVGLANEFALETIVNKYETLFRMLRESR